MDRVIELYNRHPYPPPIDDLEAYRRRWDERRRRADSFLFWPSEPYRDDRSILVAGCGTTQGAHYAIRWPRARVTAIDVSAQGLAHTEALKRKHGLENLEVRQLPVERASELGQTYDYIVCTGVLHHLVDPEAGLRALREVLARQGALHLMVYAPYGRAGVYMLQDYCRRLGIGWSDAELRDLVATLKALAPDHPIASLLRNSPDFASDAGLADSLLHPHDRAYSVPELERLLDRGGFLFGRWLRQAPYSAWCGALASTPHASKLTALRSMEQAAAVELFRGTMARHSLVAYGSEDLARAQAVGFEGRGWLDYVPIRLPDTITVKDRLPRGATAVLINRAHTFTDLYLPIDAEHERLLAAIDGARSIGDICVETEDRELAREFFQQLWRWDQVVFDTSCGAKP